MMTKAMEVLLSGGWVEATMLAVAGAGVRGVLLLGVVIAGAAALRASSAATRHALLGAGFVVLLLLPLGALLPWRLPVIPASIGVIGGAGNVADAAVGLGQPVATGLQAMPVDGAPVEPVRRSSGVGSRSSVLETRSAAGGGDSPAAEVAAETVGGADARGMLLAGALAVWLLGFILIGGRTLAGQWAARRLMKRAAAVEDGAWQRLLWESADRLDVAVDVRLLRSADAEIAFTTGVLNPAIVVPASSDGWTEERRRAVLMHELAHVRRRDLLIHHISRWACAVYWVNPLAWTGARRLRAESERAADDLVLGVGTRPSDYADHLLQIISAARPGPMPGAVLPLARRREFEGRILAILEPHLRRAEPSRVQSGVLTVGVALLALPLAALAPVDAGAEDQAAGEIGSPPDALSRAAASGGLEFRGTFEPRSAADPEMDPQLDPDPNLQPERNTWSAGDEDVDVEVEVEVAVDEDAQADPDTDSGFATEPASSAGWADLFNEGGLGDRLLALIPGGRAGESTEGQVVPPTHLADREFRLIAIDALSDTNDDPRAIAALIRLLQSDTVPGVRAAAARGLAELEAVEAVGPLGNALAQDPDARVRATAAWALGEIEDPAAVDALVVGIRDEDAEVRRSSVWALAEIEAIESAPALASVLTDPDPDVRRQAARTLGELDLAQAPPELVAALGDQDPAVRAAAARALAEIEDPSTAAALGDALGDSDPRVRAAALEALVELESPPAIEALIRALGDENPDVRRAAAQALGDI